jgi:hypothetical protein
MTSRLLLIAAAVGILGGLLRAQEIQLVDPNPAPNEQRKQIFENCRKIKLELALDRQEYLAGETMWVTLSAFNPLAQLIEVFDPLGLAMAGLDLDKWGDREALGFEHWERAVPESLFVRYNAWDAPTVTFGPGQKLESRFVLSRDADCPQRKESYPADDPPVKEGRYRLSYCYVNVFSSCSRVEFTIVEPVVAQSAFVKLKDTYTANDDETGQQKQYPLYLYGFVLASGGKRYIVLGRPPTGSPDIQPSSGGTLNSDILRGGGPYDRIAEAALDAANLALSEDASGNIRVRWDQEFSSSPGCSPNPHKICTVTVSKDRTTISPRQCLPVLCRWR